MEEIKYAYYLGRLMEMIDELNNNDNLQKGLSHNEWIKLMNLHREIEYIFENYNNTNDSVGRPESLQE